MTAAQPCNDLQVRTQSRLVPTGGRGWAEHRQTKHAWKRAVCASPCPLCKLLQDSCAPNNPARRLGRRPCRIIACIRGQVRSVHTVQSWRAVPRVRLTTHSARAGGTSRSLRFCTLRFHHWPSALHCCPSLLLLCADVDVRFATWNRLQRAPG
jgi:hypothetical protein